MYPPFETFQKLPLGGIDRRAMVTRLAEEGRTVATADLARARERLRSTDLGLPADHAVVLLGASGGILRALAIQLALAERVPVVGVHYDSEKLQIGVHHARALEEAGAANGVPVAFLNGDATRPEVIADVVGRLRGKHRVVHLVNGIAAGATKRFARFGPSKVRELDVAFDPVRQIADFTRWESLRRFGLVDVDVSSDTENERTYKFMGRSSLPWAEALAAEGLLVAGESLVAFADYDYEKDDPVYAMGPLAEAKNLQRGAMDEIASRFGARTVRLCYPAMNTTALGAIPGGLLMYAGTAELLLRNGRYDDIPTLARKTMPVFSPSFQAKEHRVDDAFQDILPDFHRFKAQLRPEPGLLRERFASLFENPAALAGAVK
jgi:enoyl-[acyl-carrier protein] reductase / trans-2-enoyl-CoA reductase (NAD+)